MEAERFSTEILDAAIARSAERLEADRQAVLGSVVQSLRSEASRLGVTEAYVLGSVTERGLWTDDSDVDVATSGGDPLEVMKAVEEAVDRPVDVIDLEAHPAPELLRRRGLRVVG